MKKYRVPFTGYCEVWADSPDEASEAAENEEMFFIEYNFGDPVCEEDENELD
jgi:hypothetical protein